MWGYLYSNVDDFLSQQLLLIQQDNQDNFVELGAAPIVQIDYEQQPPYPLQQFQVTYDDVDPIVIWPIPSYIAPPQRLPGMGAVLNISKRQRYWVPRSAMLESFDNVELLQYGSGIIRGWDTDADQQKLQQPSFQMDSQNERDNTIFFTIPTGVAAFDTDAYQQFLQAGYSYDESVVDAGVENIIQLNHGWDTDADQQFLWSPWYQDEFEDFQAFRLHPIIISVFVLGTGSAISAQLGSSNVVEEYVVKGSTSSNISASGKTSTTRSAGTVQPLIDAEGNILSSDGEV